MFCRLLTILDRGYPVSTDRGGTAADYINYPTFLANLRDALDSADKGHGLSITLASSYWYLQNFDIVNLVKSVDWVSYPPFLAFESTRS